MWLRKLVAHIKAQLKAMNEPLRDGEQARAFADAAYKSCIEWFGLPPDPKCSVELANGTLPRSFCGHALGSYRIYLSPAIKTKEWLCATVGHEMYHRVTMRRRSLRRERWVDEMLACMASFWFLDAQGYGESAEYLTTKAVKESREVDLTALRARRRPRIREKISGDDDAREKEFYTDAARVGLALVKLVGRDALCQLSQVKTWDRWLDSLPADRRALVCLLLNLPAENNLPAFDADAHTRMGYALRVTGQFDDALAEYQKSLQLRPDDADTYFQIGFIFEHLRQKDEAIGAWTRAARLDPKNVWAAYNIADNYQAREDFPAAIAWYKEALTRRPDWPCTLYYLGAVLAYNGDVAEARQTWQKIVDGGDVTYAPSAKKCLEAWKEALEGNGAAVQTPERAVDSVV